MNLKILLTLCAFLSLAWGVKAQNCSKYYPLHEGASMVYANFDGKGKESGTIAYHISDVDNSGGTTKATMQMKLTDEKGEEILTSDYNLTCEGDKVRIDFKSLMNGQMMEQFKDMEMEITGTDLELPNSLKTGQKLADANMHMKVNMGAMNMNMNVETVNRLVEKEEKITVPAGEFPCVVISGETNTKMMMGNNTMTSRTWFSEGVGVVKQESYNKKGKLIGSMELTSLTN